METIPPAVHLTSEQAKELALRAGEAFTPRTPISTKELFAGRWGEMTLLVDIVNQIGLHAILYGERGVGKTSLANVIPIVLKVFDDAANPPRKGRIVVRTNANSTDTFSSVWSKIFDDISWVDDTPSIGFKPQPGTDIVTLRSVMNFGPEIGIEEVRRTLTLLPDSVFVVDEFDRLQRKHAAPFTDLIKALADGGVPVTIIIVGVSETVDGLVKDHQSINRALVQIPLPRMKPDELREIIQNAEKKLGIVFETEAGEGIVAMSQGLPHYTHLVGLLAVRAACSRYIGSVYGEDVAKGFEQAVKSADHTIATAYLNATHSAHSAALYSQVLLACAIAAARDSDASGYFQPASVAEPLTAILRRDQTIEISTFNKHLVQFCEASRGVLERTGRTRSFRYRFRDPLMPPYVLMRGVSEGSIAPTDLRAFMRGD